MPLCFSVFQDLNLPPGGTQSALVGRAIAQLVAVWHLCVFPPFLEGFSAFLGISSALKICFQVEAVMVFRYFAPMNLV